MKGEQDFGSSSITIPLDVDMNSRWLKFWAAAGSAAAILQLDEYSMPFLKVLKEYPAKSKNLLLSLQTILS